MVGLLYTLTSLAALACGFMFQACLSDACAQLPGVFGRSWFLWGALFYALAAGLCLTDVRKSYVLAFLTGGAVLHTMLIGYGYMVSGDICPLCWKFAMLGIMLPIFYLLAPGQGIKFKSPIIRLPARALPFVVATILVVNPIPGAGEISVASVTKTGIGEISVSSTTENVFLEDSRSTFSDDQVREHIITVTTAQGQVTELDISQKPALFFAVWCPHCDEALQEIAELPRQERPGLVVTYLNQGDLAGIPEKLAQNGLAGEDYYLNQSPPAWLNMVPTLAGWDSEKNTVKIIEGAKG